ncbi:hypothetical protein SDC9_150325 [bioreactor metagenome]|uniref:Uncharacterized protein n=1 Tax=bioreactor metagenome TaxID=1076179 RepID=A0A645EPA4_9ZZZZ
MGWRLRQASCDGGNGFAAEVVDAEVGDAGRGVAVFGLGIGPVKRQADEVEPGARTQTAYIAAAQPAGLLDFPGFHGEPTVTFGFGGVGPGVEAGVVVAFEWMLAAHGRGAGNAECD